MPTNRPMSEYESALSALVEVLLRTVLEMGADREKLIADLREVQTGYEDMNRPNAAATIELLVTSLSN